MRWLSETEEAWNWDEDWKLGANIDASETMYWNDGKGFLPISEKSNYYVGVFDGQGHVISNLYINRPEVKYVGLFGRVYRSYIKNLGLENCEIVGNDYTGALVGKAVGYNNISKCFVSGKVSGKSVIGGMTGFAGVGTEISNCYSDVNVTQINDENFLSIGAFCGTNEADAIEFCYAAGNVTCVDSNEYNKGFIGENIFPDYCNYNVVNTEKTGQNTADGALPKTTTEMKTKSTFTDLNWDFDNTWGIKSDKNNGYPHLKWEDDFVLIAKIFYPEDNTEYIHLNYEFYIEFYDTIFAGSGYIFVYQSDGTLIEKFDVAEDIEVNLKRATLPVVGLLDEYSSYFILIDSTCFYNSRGAYYKGIYDEEQWDFHTSCGGSKTMPEIPENWEDGSGGTIYTLAELRWLSENYIAWNEDWILGSDIDAMETHCWNDGLGYHPIGYGDAYFSGSFDGQGYTISNLYVNRVRLAYAGLFGSISNVEIHDGGFY